MCRLSRRGDGSTAANWELTTITTSLKDILLLGSAMFGLAGCGAATATAASTPATISGATAAPVDATPTAVPATLAPDTGLPAVPAAATPETGLTAAPATAAPEAVSATSAPEVPPTATPAPTAPLVPPAKAATWSLNDCQWANATLVRDSQLDLAEAAAVKDGSDTRYRNYGTVPKLVAYYKQYAATWTRINGAVALVCQQHLAPTSAQITDAQHWFSTAKAAHAADNDTHPTNADWNNAWIAKYQRLAALFSRLPG